MSILVRIGTSFFSLVLSILTLIDTIWIYKHRENGLKKWTISIVVLFALNALFFVWSIIDQYLAEFQEISLGLGTLVSVIQRSIMATVLFLYNHAKKQLKKAGKDIL